MLVDREQYVQPVVVNLSLFRLMTRSQQHRAITITTRIITSKDNSKARDNSKVKASNKKQTQILALLQLRHPMLRVALAVRVVLSAIQQLSAKVEQAVLSAIRHLLQKQQVAMVMVVLAAKAGAPLHRINFGKETDHGQLYGHYEVQVDKATGKKRVVITDGKMIDAPFIRRAEKIVAIARSLGLAPNE